MPRSGKKIAIIIVKNHFKIYKHKRPYIRYPSPKKHIFYVIVDFGYRTSIVIWEWTNVELFLSQCHFFLHLKCSTDVVYALLLVDRCSKL